MIPIFYGLFRYFPGKNRNGSEISQFRNFIRHRFFMGQRRPGVGSVMRHQLPSGGAGRGDRCSPKVSSPVQFLLCVTSTTPHLNTADTKVPCSNTYWTLCTASPTPDMQKPSCPYYERKIFLIPWGNSTCVREGSAQSCDAPQVPRPPPTPPLNLHINGANSGDYCVIRLEPASRPGAAVHIKLHVVTP